MTGSTGFTPDVLLTLAIAAGALGLFLWNRLAVEVVGLLVMALLIVSGLVTPQEGLSGFSNEATATVALMLVLSIGLMRTGAVDAVGRWLGRAAGSSELRLLVVMITVVVGASAFLNNTAVVAVLVPTILGLTRTMGIVPSRVLMPLSFASQMGGTLTLIGTSTNLLVAGLVLDLGLPRIGIFDITPPALAVSAVGVLYLLTVGRWLMPRREAEADLLEQYELREYLGGLVVEASSRLAGSSLADARFGEVYGLDVVLIERSDIRIHTPTGSTVLRAGDLLLVQGKVSDIVHIEEVEGLRIAGTPPKLELGRSADGDGGNGGGAAGLAEVIVPPRSHLIGQTLKEIGFRARFGVSALAIQRHGHAIHEKTGRIRLEAGDILLVQGPPQAIQAMHEGREMALLGSVQVPAKRRRKRWVALAIMAGVVALPALNLVPILVSALGGAILMLLTRCVTTDEVYEEMDWSVLVLLGSILPLGIAMQSSGSAELLAAGLLRLTESWGAHGTLAAFFVLTVLLTSVISNVAAAVVLTPMAVASAGGLGVSALPFVIAVMIAASNSYITPIGYQTNLFVYGPGGYRFSDFVRVGTPLTVLSVAVATFVIPYFFPFNAR